ncbi:MAG TPA: cation:proton antiporter [Candidatus Acidoferrales bacterium]|jgi:Kef-type K+ transport system membrane component KefB|nr:cation:proton antiporter [Candidatus Acidoferrales bacterium]
MHTADPFLFQLFFIFVWAKLFGEIFERLHVPAVLGEILAGVLVGPYGAALVVPSDAIYAVAQIGAIFLLFTVGLETNPKDLLQVGRTSLYVALAGIAAPFILGFGYMMLVRGSAHEATFVAAAMVATSVGITARVLGDMHVLQTLPARIILGAAVFDDILGMILLGVVVGLVSTAGLAWAQLIVTAIEAVGFALVMLFYAPRIVKRMEPGLQRMSTHDAPLVIALAICIGLSYAAVKIGMAAIIGAFFAGLAFAEYSPRWNLQPRVAAINEFLAPFFFFSMGSRLNLAVFDRKLILSAVVISLLAFISKLVGCGLPVLRSGWKHALKVGIGMVPRGEVGLIVALVGLQMTAISEQAYALVIFMTAMTTLVAPPLLKVLFRDEVITLSAAMHPQEEQTPAMK